MGKRKNKLLDYHRERSKTLYAEVRKLRAEAKAAHKLGYEDGCKATTLMTYMGLSDYGLHGAFWISDRISAAVAKKPLPSTDFDHLITKSVIEHMAKYDPKRAAYIEAEFAAFLTK
jgi:hypothetical protein